MENTIKQVTLSHTFRVQSEFARETAGNTDTLLMEDVTPEEYKLANKLNRLKVMSECLLGAMMQGMTDASDDEVKITLYKGLLEKYIKAFKELGETECNNKAVILSLIMVTNDILEEAQEIL